MRIDRSDPLDGPDDAHVARRAHFALDDPDAAEKNNGKTLRGDGPPGSSPAHSDSAFREERSAAYRAQVHIVYRQYDIDYRHSPDGRTGCGTVTPGIRQTETVNPEPDSVGPDDRPRVKDRLADAAFLKKSETLEAPGGDVPDDPRNHSNPKTGRVDASWSAYDRAIAAARDHTGGDLGLDSIKMYDHNPEIGEGTGTLIGEQTLDRLRGWRIDGQDGHVNWWDWTGGKKGVGGAFGHDWFPEDPSTPGSRYIGWAPWQDNDGNILDGN